ncbi:MAG: hypothetical protein FWC78_02150 [Defluviitaleaceae bacterium]|nr:hypothetical protein [Defluviitaleaceae bacterium]
MKAKELLTCIFCGIAMSLLMNFSLVIATYFGQDFMLLTSFLCTVLVVLFMKSDSWKGFALSLLIIIAALAVTEVGILLSGLHLFFQQRRYGFEAGLVSPGFGVVAVVNYYVHFIFIAIGAVVAGFLTRTAAKKRRLGGKT